MKSIRTLKTWRLSALAGGFALFTGALQAAPFLYSSGDLVLAFRKVGNASDYAVNIGKATNYNNVPLGTSFNITNLSLSQLSSAFSGDYNSLKWSAAAANRLVGQDLNYPAQTIWVTKPRQNAGTQTDPWVRKSQSLQGNAASQIDAVGANAFTASSSLAGGPNNTATGVVIPVANNPNISAPIGTAGNYAGNYQHNQGYQSNVEALTDVDFTANTNNVSRADLYELIPTSGNSNGRYLGYFELKPNGTLTFRNPIPQPTITSVARTNNITTVSFTTVSGPTYRLRSTNGPGLTASVSTWTIGASIAGNGSVRSLTDTNTAAVRFFSVDAQ